MVKDVDDMNKVQMMKPDFREALDEAWALYPTGPTQAEEYVSPPSSNNESFQPEQEQNLS